MNILESYRTTPRRNKLIALAVVLLVLAVGLSYAATRAANSFASAEAEQGQLQNGATVGTDATASGGKYVQFGAGITPPAPTADLTDPAKREIAFMLVGTFENTTTSWREKYEFIQYAVECPETLSCDDNRGYTAGIIGFTSATGDMLQLVEYYKSIAPGNRLEKYLPALRNVNGGVSTNGLGQAFINDWKAAAADAKFQQAQDHLRDTMYFTPSVNLAKQDGVKSPLGQFAYYDAAVMHGPEQYPDYPTDLYDIRANAMKKAKTPAQGGDEKAYLAAFLDARRAAMKTEAGHEDTTRVDTAQLKFLNDGNLSLTPPLAWKVYGGSCSINAQGVGAGECTWE